MFSREWQHLPASGGNQIEGSWLMPPAKAKNNQPVTIVV